MSLFLALTPPTQKLNKYSIKIHHLMPTSQVRHVITDRRKLRYVVVVVSKGIKFIQSSVRTDQLLKKFKLYVKALS